VALQQVRHCAGEKFHVGAADADPLDVDDHLPGFGHRRLDVDDTRFFWSGDDEGAHDDIMADSAAATSEVDRYCCHRAQDRAGAVRSGTRAAIATRPRQN